MKGYKTTFFLCLFLLTATTVFAADEERKVVTPPASVPQIAKTDIVEPPAQIVEAVKPVDTSVAETHRQLEDIMRIHQTLELQRQQDILEIQKIMEQARVHQQLLQEFETTSPQGGGGEGGEIEEAVRQKKIELIKEQTDKNRALMEEYENRTKEKPSGEKPSEEKKQDFWWWLRKKQ